MPANLIESSKIASVEGGNAAVYAGLTGLLAALAYMLTTFADICKKSGKGAHTDRFKVGALTLIIIVLVGALGWGTWETFRVRDVKLSDAQKAEDKNQCRKELCPVLEVMVSQKVALNNLTYLEKRCRGNLERLKNTLFEEVRLRDRTFENREFLRSEALSVIDGMKSLETLCLISQEMVGRAEAGHLSTEMAKIRVSLVETLYPEAGTANDETNGSKQPALSPDEVRDRRQKALNDLEKEHFPALDLVEAELKAALVKVEAPYSENKKD